MDFQLLSYTVATTAAIIAIVLKLLSTTKAWQDVKYFDHNQLLQAKTFAAEFAEECGDPNIRRYSIELGYAALVGDGQLVGQYAVTHEARLLLLQFQDTKATIRSFLRLRKRLVKLDIRTKRIDWRSRRLSNKCYRRALNVWHSLCYCAFAAFASIPFSTSGFLHNPKATSVLRSPMCVLFFIGIGVTMAFIALLRFSEIGSAEVLIANQKLCKPDPACLNGYNVD